jgi:hypothetical protein
MPPIAYPRATRAHVGHLARARLKELTRAVYDGTMHNESLRAPDLIRDLHGDVNDGAGGMYDAWRT